MNYSQLYLLYTVWVENTYLHTDKINLHPEEAKVS